MKKSPTPCWKTAANITTLRSLVFGTGEKQLPWMWRDYLALATLSLALALFGGCVTYRDVAAPFDETEFAPYMKAGSAKIAGQAFLKTRGGDVKFGAGNTVYLVPAIPYTDEVMGLAERGFTPRKDPRMEQYVKTTVADGSGNFEFAHLPAGEYWVECGVFWTVANLYGPGSISQTRAFVRK